MTMFVINCPAISDALTQNQVRIRQQADSARQTLARLERKILQAEKAALSGNKNAERDLCCSNDTLYSHYVELDDSDWQE